ncbi:M28 family peptidase [uncultured Parasphingorhabdus sp.]|uniref:M28 family peptidase n=1 Tax=uncultured Parasphingorhabdus sp. TaxID=2709694 RepID=UPI0030D7C2DB|tara:strand:- start:17781 stop:19277 length:1497 start_codon:yes stop_codon:yes gene_type:complete
MRFIAAFILSGLLFSGAARAEAIGEADLLKHIEILASDAFEGRQPGTVGENKTVNYIATQWAEAGLRPAGEKDSWYKPVTLVERVPESSRIDFSAAASGRAVRLQQDELILRGREASFRQADMAVVFAGYAEAAEDSPSVAGKLVVLPSTPPEDRDELPDFRTRKMQLIQAGAVGVISILEDQDRWSRLQRFYQRGSTTLADPENHAALEGVISLDQFRKLIKQSGLDADRLLEETASISVLDLDLSADATARTRVRSYVSHNVIGKIPGTSPANGAVLFVGHWDHFGICRVEDPLAPEQDRICNGAVDNASGISLLIETAKRLSGGDHDRDIYFLATTAEEKGLLGARAFVSDPPIALENFVAVFNADTIALSDDGQKIAAVGLGQSALDKDIEMLAAQEGREIDRSGKSDAYLKRQDGYVFLERGLPAYMITSAFADEDRLKAYIEGPYHDVSDEVNEGLMLAGAAADANFHVALGRYFSSTATYPGLATSGGADN